MVWHGTRVRKPVDHSLFTSEYLDQGFSWQVPKLDGIDK